MGDMNIPKEMVKEAGNSFSNNNYVVTTFYNEIKSWWIESVYSYKGAPLYIFLLILTVIMVIPVATILLSISVFMSFGKIIFFCIIADTAIYVIRAILGKGFITQALDRYYHLFPDAGKRHYEKDYEKWLKNRSYEDSYEKDNIRRKKRAAFYEDNEYEDEYEDELDDDYDEEYDDEFDDDYDEEYDTESEDDYEEDFDGESDEGSKQRVNNNTSTSSGSFDFFFFTYD